MVVVRRHPRLTVSSDTVLFLHKQAATGTEPGGSEGWEDDTRLKFEWSGTLNGSLDGVDGGVWSCIWVLLGGKRIAMVGGVDAWVQTEMPQSPGSRKRVESNSSAQPFQVQVAAGAGQDEVATVCRDGGVWVALSLADGWGRERYAEAEYFVSLDCPSETTFFERNPAGAVTLEAQRSMEAGRFAGEPSVSWLSECVVRVGEEQELGVSQLCMGTLELRLASIAVLRAPVHLVGAPRAVRADSHGATGFWHIMTLGAGWAEDARMHLSRLSVLPQVRIIFFGPSVVTRANRPSDFPFPDCVTGSNRSPRQRPIRRRCGILDTLCICLKGSR